MFILNQGDYYTIGNCKLADYCKKDAIIGKLAKIMQVIDNEEKDSTRYPFIATEIQLL